MKCVMMVNDNDLMAT